MLTKQEIKTKTPAGVRELPIPDYVFEQSWKNERYMRKTADADLKHSGTGIIFAVLHTEIQEAKDIIKNIIKSC